MKLSMVAFLKAHFLTISTLLVTSLLVPAEGLMMSIQLWIILPLALLFWLFSSVVYLSQRSLF
ncbi:hypothetical protein [Streptococcus ovuberis]|uniref:Uncharacterized protein n=1 Tax=Streptococcus ovuberis TaxID=1936207 RepID=A0A7X6N047_9STRE|nr:hypothetical protein [Streptococcus ovuberis]NKZ19777.1 hypothetical protein [Streptococcus ovuberis]